jgi:hypothetical protein
MRRLSRAFWPILVGALLPFVFANQPWAGWPGEFVLTTFGVERGMANQASDWGTVGLFVLFILVNAAVWGSLFYLLARLVAGRWLTEPG